MAFDSEIYVNNKIKFLNQCGIQTNLRFLEGHNANINNLKEIIQENNENDEITGQIIQYPFNDFNKNDQHQANYSIIGNKDIDGLTWDYSNWLLNNHKPIIPVTPLGILTIFKYYKISTMGKHVVIIGKGDLIANPLQKLLENAPFYASVTKIDIFTNDMQEIFQTANIIVTCVPTAHILNENNIRQGCIIIDAGIAPNLQTEGPKILGNVHPNAHKKAQLYTTVPRGVGLLTTSVLAFNIQYAAMLQKGLNPFNILENIKSYQQQMKQNAFNQIQVPVNRLKIGLSGYNGFSQNVEKHLMSKGHVVKFISFTSPEEVKTKIFEYQPDIVICPTLMHVIPQEIYKKFKCIIVHPGIRGDRGPSSLDWVILNNLEEWGVTLVEAHEEMDAGDIWASKNFVVPHLITKAQLYNRHVVPVAIELIDLVLEEFANKEFVPQVLDYSNPDIKGFIHEA